MKTRAKKSAKAKPEKVSRDVADVVALMRGMKETGTVLVEMEGLKLAAAMARPQMQQMLPGSPPFIAPQREVTREEAEANIQRSRDANRKRIMDQAAKRGARGGGLVGAPMLSIEELALGVAREAEQAEADAGARAPREVPDAS